jgi:hypothetical protein
MARPLAAGAGRGPDGALVTAARASATACEVPMSVSAPDYLTVPDLGGEMFAEQMSNT